MLKRSPRVASVISPSLLAMGLAAICAACSPVAPSRLSHEETQFEKFVKIDQAIHSEAAAAPSIVSSPSPTAPSLPTDPISPELTQPSPLPELSPVPPVLDPCLTNALCQQRRLEFRYVVYVGKQIYAYWPEKKAETGTDFDALASVLERSITPNSTATDYFLVLRRWAAAFHDGHVNVLGKPDDSELEIYTAPVRLEMLAPGTDHEKLIIADVTSSPEFEPEASAQVGDEVLAINGTPVQEAIDQAELHTSGSTRRMRRLAASIRIVDAMGSRDGSQVLRLNIRSLKESVVRDVTFYRTVELNSRVPEGMPILEDNETGINFIKAMILPGGIGYLRIDAFRGTQSTFLLEQAMSRLQGTQGLLLDLRKNGGGDQSANAILSRLVTSAITRYQVSERLSDFTLASRPNYFFLPWNPGDEFAQWHPLSLGAVFPQNRYGNKPVVALTSPRCFSACDTFVSALKVNRLATIAGEPTGGGTGTPLVFTLPFSNQKFRYSVVRGRAAKGETIEGVGTAPDEVIEPTQTERGAGKDRQVIRALEVLQRQIEVRTRSVIPAPIKNESNAVPATPLLASSVDSTPSTTREAEWDAALRSVSREMGNIWRQDATISPSRSEARELRSLMAIDEM